MNIPTWADTGHLIYLSMSFLVLLLSKSFYVFQIAISLAIYMFLDLPNLSEGKLFDYSHRQDSTDKHNKSWAACLVSNFASSENDLFLPAVTIGSYYPVHIDPQNKCLNYFLYHHVSTSLVIEGEKQPLKIQKCGSFDFSLQNKLHVLTEQEVQTFQVPFLLLLQIWVLARWCSSCCHGSKGKTF